MQRISGPTALANANGTGKIGFQNLNKALGILGTIVTAAWLNALQEEVCSVVEGGGGLVLDTGDNTQLRRAIDKMITAALSTISLPGAASETVSGLVELATIAEAKAGIDTSRAVTPAGLGATIAALVNGAPGALDTLNELAAALGDDANFAATVTNALALKAPLASPVLTGTPTAPTAAAGTSTTQLATTAFVSTALSGISLPGAATTSVAGLVKLATIALAQAGVDATTAMTPALVRSMLGNYRTNYGLAGAQTLTSDHLGSIIMVSPGAAFTLPAASSTHAGDSIYILPIGGLTNSSAATVATQGTDQLHVVDCAITTTAAGISGGVLATLISDGASRWYLHRGDLGFGLFAPNGYYRLPGGLILQWGVFGSSGASSYVITFPMAFPTACLCAQVANNSGSSDPKAYHGVGLYTTTYFRLNSSISSIISSYWFALGY